MCSGSSGTPTSPPPRWGAPSFPDSHPIGWTSGKVKFLPRPKKSFSPEFKDEAVKMVIETSRPIARVAKELGINEGTLGNWVSVYRREHAGEEPHESTSSVMVLVHPWRAAAGRMMAWADVEMGGARHFRGGRGRPPLSAAPAA